MSVVGTLAFFYSSMRDRRTLRKDDLENLFMCFIPLVNSVMLVTVTLFSLAEKYEKADLSLKNPFYRKK